MPNLAAELMDDDDPESEHTCDACDFPIYRRRGGAGFQCSCCGAWYHRNCGKSKTPNLCRFCRQEQEDMAEN